MPTDRKEEEELLVFLQLSTNTEHWVVVVLCAFVSVLLFVCLADVRLVESVYVLCTYSHAR